MYPCSFLLFVFTNKCSLHLCRTAAQGVVQSWSQKLEDQADLVNESWNRIYLVMAKLFFFFYLLKP